MLVRLMRKLRQDASFKESANENKVSRCRSEVSFAGAMFTQLNTHIPTVETNDGTNLKIIVSLDSSLYKHKTAKLLNVLCLMIVVRKNTGDAQN